MGDRLKSRDDLTKSKNYSSSILIDVPLLSGEEVATVKNGLLVHWWFPTE